jgi:hypothetical protein
MSLRSNGGLDLAATTAELRNSIMMNHSKVLRRIIPRSVRLVRRFRGGVGEREVIRFLPVCASYGQYSVRKSVWTEEAIPCQRSLQRLDAPQL